MYRAHCPSLMRCRDEDAFQLALQEKGNQIEKLRRLDGWMWGRGVGETQVWTGNSNMHFIAHQRDSAVAIIGICTT